MTGRVSGATERALARVERGETAYSAAKAEGIALSTIYRAVRREREKDETMRELLGLSRRVKKNGENHDRKS